MEKLAEQVKSKDRKENKENYLRLLEKGKALVNLFYSTLKTAQLYEPNNSAFQKQIFPFADLITRTIQAEGELSLSSREGFLFLNQARLRFDFENYVAIRFSLDFLQKLKVFKITFESGLNQQELQNFICILAHVDPNEKETL